MMKKVFITQRLDCIGKFNEKRNNLDVRFISIFQKLKILPIIIPNNIFIAEKMLKMIKVDGVILSSGGNALKKDERHHTESLLLRFACRKNIPLLGICRGAQAINLFFSGKIRKIQNHVRKKHLLYINLTKKIPIKTNCYHDYGIYKKDLGRNLKSLGETKDESIEIFKHKNKKILGMMWHPERHNNLRSFELKIIKNLF